MTIVVVAWLLSAILCAIIAQSKGLNVGSWALGGLVFGIFAVVVVALTRPAGEARLIQSTALRARSRVRP